MSRVIFIAFILNALSGCATWESPRLNDYVYQSEVPYEGGDKSVEAAPVGHGAEFLEEETPEVKEALKQFKKTGRAPIIRKAGFRQYPFGESQPLMICAPLRGCDIELQAGEEVLGVVVGDPVRWSVQKFFSGQNGEVVPHIIVKPVDWGIASNIVIGTNKRTYYLGLLSKKGTYVRRFKFYYPQDVIRYLSDESEFRKGAEELAKARARLSQGKVQRSIYTSYQVRAPKDVTWVPNKVYDDGVRVFIEFPEHLLRQDLPGIFVKQIGTNSVSQPNWRLKGATMVVDGVFDEAYLLAGVGGEQRRVQIRRR